MLSVLEEITRAAKINGAKPTGSRRRRRTSGKRRPSKRTRRSDKVVARLLRRTAP